MKKKNGDEVNKMKDDYTRPLLYTGFCEMKDRRLSILSRRRANWHEVFFPTLVSRLQAVINPVGVAGANSYPQIDQSKSIYSQ